MGVSHLFGVLGLQEAVARYVRFFGGGHCSCLSSLLRIPPRMSCLAGAYASPWMMNPPPVRVLTPSSDRMGSCNGHTGIHLGCALPWALHCPRKRRVNLDNRSPCRDAQMSRANFAALLLSHFFGSSHHWNRRGAIKDITSTSGTFLHAAQSHL